MTAPDSDPRARRVLVRYSVHPAQVERNEALVRAVYDELGRARPPGLCYATFRLEDSREFVHLASTVPSGAGNPLTELAAFRAFQRSRTASGLRWQWQRASRSPSSEWRC